MVPEIQPQRVAVVMEEGSEQTGQSPAIQEGGARSVAGDVTPAAVAPAAVLPDPEKPYPEPSVIPTQEGPLGIRFDYNLGCRVTVPQAAEPWDIRLVDTDTDSILFQTTLVAGLVRSSKRYFLRCRIEVRQGGELVFSHDYDARRRRVLILFPVGTLGDTLGWFPYAARFQALHGCHLTCAMADRLIPLFQKAYPQIEFVDHAGVDLPSYYATYYTGLFFDDTGFVHQPSDFRMVGLHRTAGYILGVDPTEAPAEVVLEDATRPVEQPYVCIATQSSTQAKHWNHPYGWHQIIPFLKEAGYRVICIDRGQVTGQGMVWNHIPNGAEDETGDRPLQERARWLAHAEFFVGLSSGLSWLAWTMRCPVVLISGFTHPSNEFATPHRVINYHACNSCWNDPQHHFDHKDFLWCPRHAGTARQFECTRLIAPEQVKRIIRAIPGFGSGNNRHPEARSQETTAVTSVRSLKSNSVSA